MQNKYTYKGTSKKFATFIARNAECIAKACNWSEIQRVENPCSYGDSGVEEVRILHKDGTRTFLFCQVSNHGFPMNALNAVIEVSHAIISGAINESKCRVVVVSPNIDIRLVNSIQGKSFPASLMMVTPDKCFYWESESISDTANDIKRSNEKLTKLTEID